MTALTPYICVADAQAAIDWYTTVLDGRVAYDPIVMDDGRVGHAELVIGDSLVMLSDPFDEAGVAAPDPQRHNAVSLHLAVADVDETVRRASERGATLDRGPEDTPHGRIAVIHDPFGHRWMLNSAPTTG